MKFFWVRILVIFILIYFYLEKYFMVISFWMIYYLKIDCFGGEGEVSKKGSFIKFEK